MEIFSPAKRTEISVRASYKIPVQRTYSNYMKIQPGSNFKSGLSSVQFQLLEMRFFEILAQNIQPGLK